MKKITRKQIERNRYQGNSIVDYHRSYCDLHSCCDECNPKVRFICKIKCKLTTLVNHIILKEVDRNVD